MNLRQAKLFLSLIENVEAFPAKHFDKRVFSSGKRRCAAGILADTDKNWTWDWGLPEMKDVRFYHLTVNKKARKYFGLPDDDSVLFNGVPMTKKEWLKLAYEILDREGFEVCEST